MSWLPLGIGAPAILWGLLALPIIWWLLRLTPPKPLVEVFPPLKILARVARKDETPSKSPWWLTALRLLMAALIIFALAEPVLNPRERLPANGSALALVIDNGWSSAGDWQRRLDTAGRLINDAEANEMPILLAFTADRANQQLGPYSAGEARDRLSAMRPRPVPVDRQAVYGRIATELQRFPGASIAVLTDGLATPADTEAFGQLLGQNPAGVVWVQPDNPNTVAMTAAANEVDRFVVTAARLPGDTLPRAMNAGAFDNRGRRIGDAAINFGMGETSASGEIVVPFELRNDFATIRIDGEANAGGVRVLDNSDKRRRVGLIAQTQADRARMLLSPMYYLHRAMTPFADLVEPTSPEVGAALKEILDQKPAVIVMADVGVVPDTIRPDLVRWLNDGGTLVRFASSSLISAGNDEELLPVQLRGGERELGGAMSWTQPQPVTEFPPTGPFSDLTPPSEVIVNRQILAEPTPDLVDRTWATLADGTPLVTADRKGRGIVVLFHVTPQATWSNLPISGTFVEMLRRIVQLSRNQGAVAAGEANGQQAVTAAALAPYRMISADGQITPPDAEARPLELRPNVQPAVTIDNPPGLYGTEEGVVSHNLFTADATLAPIVRPQITVPLVVERYAENESTDLKGPLLTAALLFFLIDALIVLWLAGRFRSRPRRPTAAAGAAVILLALTAGGLFVPGQAHAQDQRPDDAAAVEAISTTRLAYVITGDPQVDAISRAGLTGLSRFLIEKTALEPGDPVGVNIASDELAFFPIIYWPVDPNAAMPTPEALARIDAYMKNGGTVLFDTRDQMTSSLDPAGSPANARLREILSDINVPPLEPVPDDHVLGKAFFLLKTFPGRFDGSPLWVEASIDASNNENRPVRTGDGVTPIMITGNDLAGAWAIDQTGNFMLPTVPGDPMQRTYAYRTGVNIIIYMLTGNYKSDQVHVKDLLERLGQ